MSKADDIFIREFLIILGCLVAFFFLALFVARAIGANAVEQASLAPREVAARIQPVGSLRVAGPDTAATAEETEPMQVAAVDSSGKSGEEVYSSACAACHAAGVAGAPKVGDKAAWETRAQQGLDTLVSHAVNGINAMPAKGGNASLSDAEIRKSVIYMLEQTGVAAETGADTGQSDAAQPSAADDTADAGGADGEKVYNSACVVCHASGVAGAPKVGDKAGWETRAQQGLDTLIAHAINGKGTMPAKGGHASLSDDEVKSAVEYMLAASEVPAN